jgi:hypothetical protein
LQNFQNICEDIDKAIQLGFKEASPAREKYCH